MLTKITTITTLTITITQIITEIPAANSGNVNNNNSPISNPTNSFGSSGQFDVSVQASGSQVSDEMMANINCQVAQNGNNIQVSLDLITHKCPQQSSVNI